MLLNEKERHCADECYGAEVAHKDSVGGDEFMLSAETNTGGDTDSDRIGHNNEC